MVRIFGRYVRSAVAILAATEILTLACAFYLGAFLRFADIANFSHELRTYSLDAAIFVMALWLSMFAFGLYQTDSLTDRRITLVRLVVSFFVGFVVIATLQYSFKGLSIYRSILGIALLSGMSGIMVVRLFWSPVFNASAFRRRVLVLGTGERAASIETLERRQRAKAFSCLGFVQVGGEAVRVSSSRVLGDPTALMDMVKSRNIGEVVVAVQDRRKELPIDALLDIKFHGVTVLDATTFWERQTGLIDLDNVYPSWLIFCDGFGRSVIQRPLKRVFDLVVSIVFLVITLPVLLVTAVAIKCETRGPILYRQLRIGQHGKPFALLKFRSMYADAERDGVPRWATVGDNRITRVGSFIRRTRIDEMPQVFNVLRGEMSFVGPRPERPFFVEQLTDQIRYYRERHRVKPGITGWAQINFRYGASAEDAKQKLQYDLYYIKNYSLLLDFIILLQTARVVLWPGHVR